MQTSRPAAQNIATAFRISISALVSDHVCEIAHDSGHYQPPRNQPERVSLSKARRFGNHDGSEPQDLVKEFSGRGNSTSSDAIVFVGSLTAACHDLHGRPDPHSPQPGRPCPVNLTTTCLDLHLAGGFYVPGD
jgi:hypothetical protein